MPYKNTNHIKSRQKIENSLPPKKTFKAKAKQRCSFLKKPRRPRQMKQNSHECEQKWDCNFCMYDSTYVPLHIVPHHHPLIFIIQQNKCTTYFRRPMNSSTRNSKIARIFYKNLCICIKITRIAFTFNSFKNCVISINHKNCAKIFSI